MKRLHNLKTNTPSLCKIHCKSVIGFELGNRQLIMVHVFWFSDKMEAMMSNILATASSRLYGTPSPDVPLDLSWNKGHSCERFVNHEDLRPEPYLAPSDGDTSVVSSASSTDDEVAKLTSHNDSFTRKWYVHPTIRSTFGITPRRTDDRPSSTDQERLEEKRESAPTGNNNPFSIDSILGSDVSDGSDDDICESEPAQVYSSYIAAISGAIYSQYSYASLGGIFQQPLTSTPSKPETFKPLDDSKKVFWCHKCNIFCSDRTDAVRHQQVHSYRGDTCSLKRLLFQEHGYVSAHEQTGYLDRIECVLCKKVVANCFFMKHMGLHDGHVCDVCDHEFSTNSKLQDHMNVHSGLASFSCKLCDRKFSKKSSLTQHQRYHREYKCYSCRFCSKSFNSKYTCNVHERIHTGETPFKCEKPGCNKGFPQKIQLRLHMATHKKRGEL